jgi:hypothetical protein
MSGCFPQLPGYPDESFQRAVSIATEFIDNLDKFGWADVNFQSASSFILGFWLKTSYMKCAVFFMRKKNYTQNLDLPPKK